MCGTIMRVAYHPSTASFLGIFFMFNVRKKTIIYRQTIDGVYPRGNHGLVAIGRRNFAVSGPETWNSLPGGLRLSTLSTAIFARRRKAHLIVSTE